MAVTQTNQAFSISVGTQLDRIDFHMWRRLFAPLHAQHCPPLHRQSSIPKATFSILGRTTFAGGDDA